jgi:FtsP/CotA-like multicopper oxidase with cupredoxin domain
MIRLLFAAALVTATFANALAKPANYSGAWTLDMKQSQNLPSYYSHVQSHKLSITQDDKQLRVAVEISDTEREPFRVDFVYSLDGAETKTETQMRTPAGMRSVPTVLKAVASEDGALRITITREMQTPDGRALKAVTTEDWRLSPDAKTLTIHRADDTPRGKTESDMVFIKA